MSVVTNDLASAFLAPLKGNFALLLWHDIKTKTDLSRLIVGCLQHQPGPSMILDSGVFYSTNVKRITDGSGLAEARISLLPEGDFEVSALLPLVSSEVKLLVIDDLNSLYSLAADGRRLHQLTVLLKMLSYNARINDTWVIATASRTDASPRREDANQRSLATAGDMVVDAESKGNSLTLKARFMSWWPRGELAVYFEM